MKAEHVELRRAYRMCGCGKPATHEVWAHPGNRQMGPWCLSCAKDQARRLAKDEGTLPANVRLDP